MKFTVKRDQLLKPLQLVNGVVERRQTLPILGNVLLTVGNKILNLTGTDLEVELSGHGTLQKVIEEGNVTVPARKLFDICRSLPDESSINIKMEQHKLYLSAGNSRFSLMTLPAIEFPKVKDSTEGIKFSADIENFKTLITRTQYAMAQQDVRYYLNGTLWQIENNVLTAVATDGHRLALCKLQVMGEDAATNAKVIIPRKAIIEMGRVLNEGRETINVVIGANSVRVNCDDFVLTTKIIEGRYPDYQNVIPKGSNSELIIDRDRLKPVLARVAILSNEKYRGVRLCMEENILKVNANNPEHEEAEESMDVNFKGEPLEIGLNVNYLLDILSTMPKGNIIFTFSGAGKSIVIEHEKEEMETVNVIMPMRL